MLMSPALKYCGNHSLNDLRAVYASHADYIGFVFTHKSKRTVSTEQVSQWLNQIGRCKGKQLVGVFADDSLDTIKSVCEHVPLDVVQLHGGESLHHLIAVKKMVDQSVWKALHHDETTLDQMRRFRGAADGFIIDTKRKGTLGGTGKRFDWHRIPNYLSEAKRQQVPCFIAGGITPENIEELMMYQPTGIDIASGIERHFGKDQALIRSLEEKVGVNDGQTSTSRK